MECSCSLQTKIDSSTIVQKTNSYWSLTDYVGAIKVRMSLGRNGYIVKPGLYKLGNPDRSSEVFVTANYKLTFDILRKNLFDLNVWILVLDTKGINVWCAAGKGTFGTDELVSKITEYKLHEVVEHKRVIVPQLGAVGVSGYKVKKASGFKVIFGPVMAKDIKAFIFSGCKADESMRQVPFGFLDRLILTPVEIVNSSKYLVIALLILGITLGIRFDQSSITFSIEQTFTAALFLSTSYMAGAFFTPILLPWLPSRYFAMKGIISGSLIFLTAVLVSSIDLAQSAIVGWLFLSLAISSFLAMNFTGASTYTSLSGVKKEMRIFVPIQIALGFVGLVLVMISKFLSL